MDFPVLHMPLGGGFCWSAASERASWQGFGAHSIKAYCVPATSDGQRFRLVSCERAGEGGWCDQSKLTRPPCWRRAGEKRESGKTRATVTSVMRMKRGSLPRGSRSYSAFPIAFFPGEARGNQPQSSISQSRRGLPPILGAACLFLNRDPRKPIPLLPLPKGDSDALVRPTISGKT